MKKRIVGILLAVITALSLLPATAFADSGFAVINGTPLEDKDKNGGYITVAESAGEGDGVEVTVVPNSGYKLKSLTYKPAPKTVADILPEDFPSAESETSGAPAGAWKSATLDQLCYLSSDGSKLLFYSESGDPDKSFGIDTDAVLSADEGDYVYENGAVTVTFTMSGEGGAMNSVVFANTENTTWDGTYQGTACVAAGTMITMSNGERKKIEDLKTGDMIRTFDHENGEVSSAPVCFIWESKNAANAFTLTFEDGIKVTVIEQHGFYDCGENKYVFINAGNAKDYIGHYFYNADTGSRTALEGFEMLRNRVDAYAIATAVHLNHLSDGMLSVCDGTFEKFANLFEFDSSMKYDAELKKKDIETYGLTSPEKILEYKGFNEADYYDYNLQYTDIALGKGLITPEWIKAVSDYCAYNNIYDSVPTEIPAAPVSVSLPSMMFESDAEDGTEITADGDGNYIFTMPGYAVVVTAEFESAYYELSLSLEDGLDKDNIPEGTDFTVTIQLTGASPENEDIRVSLSNGTTYDLVTDGSGQAVCEIKGVAAGSYLMFVEHVGDYDTSMALMTFAVVKQTSPETGDAGCAAVLVMLTALSAGVVLGKKKKNAR